MWQEIEVDKKIRDEDNNIIENKLGYYKEALLRNIRKFKNNEIELDEKLGWFKEKEEYGDSFKFEDFEENLELDY